MCRQRRRVASQSVTVRCSLPESDTTKQREVCLPMRNYKIVILGGGLVAGYAAEAFVEAGLEPGTLGVISAEKMLPYDRPPLSKEFLLGEKERDALLINDRGFYSKHGINVLLDSPAISLDLSNKQIRLEDGESIGYEKLLIATGAGARRLELPGSDLSNIFYLRQVDDSQRIREAARHADKAVVIGGSFIGMEVSSVLQRLGVDTTLVFPESRVWETFFTPEMSSFFERTYRDRGVTIVSNATVMGFSGDRSVEGVTVEADGQSKSVPADMVVAGVGVEPNVDLFEDTGLKLDNGIVVDRFLETSVRGVYAAGDIACFPDQVFDRRKRIEHWDNAATQGQHVARVMMGDRQPYVRVPYFFSDVFDLSYEFWGDSSKADNVVHRGDVGSGSFSVWWFRNDRLVAAFIMDRPERERELAPEWIRGRAAVSTAALDMIEDPETA